MKKFKLQRIPTDFIETIEDLSLIELAANKEGDMTYCTTSYCDCKADNNERKTILITDGNSNLIKMRIVLCPKCARRFRSHIAEKLIATEKSKLINILL
ncbi:MAG: hypothetical protein J5708_05865 [Bacteroidales bacterium]|nr:hypothetical protein [Bacteroidales bacterium]